MKKAFPLWPRVAVLFLASVSLISCGQKPGSVFSSTTINISNPDNEWGRDIQYVSGTDGTSVSVDGVKFEILDHGSATVDFEALGLTGVTVTNTKKLSVKSIEESEGAFLVVLDRPVAIREGVLFWGDKSLGEVSKGDVFIADSQGLRPKP